MARYPLTAPTKDMTFKQWSSQQAQDLARIRRIQIPISRHENKWRQWVAELMMNPVLSTIPTPSSAIYPGDEGWRAWALDFIANFPVSLLET